MTSALQIARDAVEQIQRHLQRINEFTQDDDTQRSHEIDDEIHSINQVAISTVADGNHLLDGTWSVSVADPAGDGVQNLRLPSLHCDALGNEGIGGFVSSLATDGEQSSSLARNLAVIRCAVLQAASIRERVAAFLKDVAKPMIEVLSVAAANADAAQIASQDTDLARQVSQLTKLDAMMHTCPDPQKKHPQNFYNSDVIGRIAGKTRPSDNNHLD